MVNQRLNLSLNELKLIAENRNASDYENKSAKDLIKAHRGSRLRLGIKKDKLKEAKEDFYNLRHKFSKKDADKYGKLFYNIKNYRNFSELEIEKIRKKLNKLEYEKLSPREYLLNMIRPDLRDLINRHKPIERLNNDYDNDNNNNNNNNNDNDNNNNNNIIIIMIMIMIIMILIVENGELC